MTRQATTMHWIEQREAREMLATVGFERASPVCRRASCRWVSDSAAAWLESLTGWLAGPFVSPLLQPQPVPVRRYAVVERRRIDEDGRYVR